MCGYTSYQDPRLMPPDINDEDDCDYIACRHRDACERQLYLHKFLPGSPDDATEMLRCDECGEWDD